MTAVDKTDTLEVFGPGSVEVYQLEIENAETLVTKFTKILAVLITENETSSGGTATYATSGGTITFYVDAKGTYGVMVLGRM
jgi:hypothetical protein